MCNELISCFAKLVPNSVFEIRWCVNTLIYSAMVMKYFDFTSIELINSMKN
jgi:hypothetical protein